MLEHLIADCIVAFIGIFLYHLLNRRSITSEITNIVRENVDLKDRVRKVSHLDPLTDLPNRSAFFDEVDSLTSKAAAPFAILIIDIDGFKHLNDTLGHIKGDIIIQQLAQRIRLSITTLNSSVARVGGDEFAVVLDQLQAIREIEDVSERILRSINAPISIDGEKLELSASIGVAIFPHDASTTTDLIRYADISLYEAKVNGKNRYEFFTLTMSANFKERQQIEQNLRTCLEQQPDNFMVYYQPKIDMRTGEVVGAEALARWQLDGHIVPPNKFIPIAEDSGLIVLLGELVLRRTAAMCHRLSSQNIAVPVSVNVSPHQFINDSVMQTILDISLEYDTPTLRYIEIEITESSFMTNRVRAVEILTKLNRLGIRIAIDDFGTGWSSLAYLTDFPLDILKLDKGFVEHISLGDTRIIDTIISMAESLHLDVVAEGVETISQAKYLQEKGVNIAQGFLYAKPMPEHEFLAFIAQHNVKRNGTITLKQQTTKCGDQ